MVRDETDAQLIPNQQRNIFTFREIRFDKIGLAVEFILIRLNVAFVDRSRHHCIDETVTQVIGGKLECRKRRFPRYRSGKPRLHLQLLIGVIDDVDALRLCLRRVTNNSVRHLFHAEIFLVIRKHFRLPVNYRDERIKDACVR